MDLFLGFKDRRFYSAADQLRGVDSLELNQDNREPLTITVVEQKAAKDMTNWVVVAGFVGAPGKPSGTVGSPDMAALTPALSYDSGAKRFEGILNCDTAETVALIGAED